MANVSVYNMEGKEVGKMDLSDSVFGVEVNEHLVHMAVIQQLADNRQGTQKAKTRSEVSGGGRKPWRQKRSRECQSYRLYFKTRHHNRQGRRRNRGSSEHTFKKDWKKSKNRHTGDQKARQRCTACC